MTLPNFVVAGAMKAGTTSLFNYLGQHPQVYTSPIKETRFFNYDAQNPDHVSKSFRDFPVRTLQEYESQFDGVTNELAQGEASPNYLIGPHAPLRMKEVIPDVRLVFSLRHPVDRLYSLYQMQVIGGSQSGNVYEVFYPGSEWAEKGRYAPHFSRWLNYFDRSQMKIILAENLRTNPQEVLQSLFRYLEIDDRFTPDLSKRYNSGGVPRNRLSGYLVRGMRYTMFHVRRMMPMVRSYVPESVKSMKNSLNSAALTTAAPLPPVLAKELADYYAEDVQQLESMLDIDLSSWRIVSESTDQT